MKAGDRVVFVRDVTHGDLSGWMRHILFEVNGEETPDDVVYIRAGAEAQVQMCSEFVRVEFEGGNSLRVPADSVEVIAG